LTTASDFAPVRRIFPDKSLIDPSSVSSPS
jgi:hypothetical protein